MLPPHDLALCIKTVVLCLSAGMFFVHSPTNILVTRALTAGASPSSGASVRRR